MQSKVSHLVYFLPDFEQNLPLYRQLFAYFGYQTNLDEEDVYGVVDPEGIYIYLNPAIKNQSGNYDSGGLNHLAFEVESPKEVDQFIQEFLHPRELQQLFHTPRHRPEFADVEGGYYQVMFEMPGGLLFEVVSYKKI